MASDNNNNNFEELLAMWAFPFRVNGRPLIPPSSHGQYLPKGRQHPSKQLIQGLNHWCEGHNIYFDVLFYADVVAGGRFIQYNVLAIISLFAEFNPPPTHDNNKIICIFICFITSIKRTITKGSMGCVGEWEGPTAHPELTLIIII